MWVQRGWQRRNHSQRECWIERGNKEHSQEDVGLLEHRDEDEQNLVTFEIPPCFFFDLNDDVVCLTLLELDYIRVLDLNHLSVFLFEEIIEVFWLVDLWDFLGKKVGWQIRSWCDAICFAWCIYASCPNIGVLL